MKNIDNAFLVLSIADIKAMLAAVELEQKSRGNFKDSVTLLLQGITVHTEDGEEPQIASWSVNQAVKNAVKETEKDMACTATMKRAKTKLEGASVGDAVVIVIAGGTHQSAILTHFSKDRAHFAWTTGPGKYDGACCSFHSSKWNQNIIAVFPKGAKFLAV